MCILFIRSLRVWELLPEANYDKRYHSRSILLFLFFMYVHARTCVGCKIKLSSWQLNHSHILPYWSTSYSDLLDAVISIS